MIKCEICAGTGILGWNDICKKTEKRVVAARIPTLCKCETGLDLWLDVNKPYVQYCCDIN